MEMIEDKKSKMKSERAVAVNLHAPLAEVCAGLSRDDAETVSGRIEAAAFGECEICYQDPCRGVLVAREVDHTNGRGMFTVFGLCEYCHLHEMNEVLSSFRVAGFDQPAIYWFERKRVH
jgi:hypothetical protein